MKLLMLYGQAANMGIKFLATLKMTTSIFGEGGGSGSEAATSSSLKTTKRHVIPSIYYS